MAVARATVAPQSKGTFVYYLACVGSNGVAKTTNVTVNVGGASTPVVTPQPQLCSHIDCPPPGQNCSYQGGVTSICDANVQLTCGRLVCINQAPTITSSDSCTLSLTNNQTVSGSNVVTGLSGSRSGSSYLSFWAVGTKYGDLQLFSTNTSSGANITWNSLIYNNGSHIVECRLQNSQSGGTISAKQYAVNVQN